MVMVRLWKDEAPVVVSVMSMIADLAGLWVHGLGAERRGTAATVRIAEDGMVGWLLEVDCIGGELIELLPAFS
jgi:hypothetical protein